MLSQAELAPRAESLEDTQTSEGLGVLRFLTCGSVDDGKSTLIGRLLYDCSLIPDDQLEAIAKDSRRYGTTGGVDLALLVDGLQAEREQGITIDVAYRYFATRRRSFIVADTPGHEQYTRNMVSGASQCDLAVLLLDARKGILPQTKRHSHIIFQLGIRDIVLAVNKMDLADFLPQTFEIIAADYRNFAKKLGLANVTIIPIVARDGDNVTALSQRMPWYKGPSLLSFLETVEFRAANEATPFRFPIQWVNRPNGDFRGYSGTVASGTLSRDDQVLTLPSGRLTRVRRLLSHGAELDQASAGDAIVAVLADEIDLSRGDMLVAPSNRPVVADQFAAQMIWMDDEKMVPHRSYLIRCGTQWSTAEITSIKHKVSIETMESISGDTLALNELAVCNISTNRPLIFDPYVQN